MYSYLSNNICTYLYIYTPRDAPGEGDDSAHAHTHTHTHTLTHSHTHTLTHSHKQPCDAPGESDDSGVECPIERVHFERPPLLARPLRTEGGKQLFNTFLFM